MAKFKHVEADSNNQGIPMLEEECGWELYSVLMVEQPWSFNMLLNASTYDRLIILTFLNIII